MRQSSQLAEIERFMSELGKKIRKPANFFFTGGATAVMLEIRESTVDVDIKFEPDELDTYRVIQELKENLNINIELASPDNFIPPLPYWKERSVFITTKGKVSFFHYDLYSQIISKVLRGWNQDLADAQGFLKFGLDKNKLLQFFNDIKPAFVKYPTVNTVTLEQKLINFVNEN